MRLGALFTAFAGFYSWLGIIYKLLICCKRCTFVKWPLICANEIYWTVFKFKACIWSKLTFLSRFCLLTLFLYRSRLLFINWNNSNSGKYQVFWMWPWVAAQAMRWPGVSKVLGLIPLTSLLICWEYLHVQVALRGYCSVKSGGSASRLDVSDAIVRSWLWSTATGSCPFGYFSSITANSW